LSRLVGGRNLKHPLILVLNASRNKRIEVG
jgi:hypothetical protein